jgi:hypothetical protein
MLTPGPPPPTTTTPNSKITTINTTTTNSAPHNKPCGIRFHHHQPPGMMFLTDVCSNTSCHAQIHFSPSSENKTNFIDFGSKTRILDLILGSKFT